MQSTRVVIAIALIMFSVSSAAAEAFEVPTVITHPGAQWPIWVAADIAVGDDGSLRDQYLGQFAPSLRKLARANTAALAAAPLQTTDDGCRLYRGHIVPADKPTKSLADLTTYPAAIVSGEVVAMRQGFFGGLPGTLLLLSGKYLRGTPAPEPLLFYPFAQIETADGMICAKPLGDFVAPQIGDRFLVFAMGEPRVDDGRTIFAVNTARQLVHAPRGGKLLLPDGLRSMTVGSSPFDSVESTVARSIAERVTKDQ